MRSGDKADPTLWLALALVYIALLAYAFAGDHWGSLPEEFDRLREAIKASVEVFRL